MPMWGGTDDAVATVGVALSGSAEAGGDANRRWCDVIHREVPQAKAIARARNRRRRPTTTP
jgi:hypothetical protein